jgi:PAS domain S-box-containing protein
VNKDITSDSGSVKLFVSREELFDSVRNSVYPAAITTFDVNNPVLVFANAAHKKLTGYSAEDIIGKNPRLFQGENTDRSVVTSIKSSLKSFDSWEGKILNYTKAGKPYVVFLLIFGVSISAGERFYVVVKRRGSSQ